VKHNFVSFSRGGPTWTQVVGRFIENVLANMEICRSLISHACTETFHKKLLSKVIHPNAPVNKMFQNYL
jgi:hypothetical protein